MVSGTGFCVWCIVIFGYVVSQIIFHCIDDDMMTFDYESVFRSSVGGLVLLVVRLVSFEKLTL